MADLLDELKDELRDRYEIVRKLGAGGMATVFLARDLKHDRLVAVKVLKPELGATLGAARFLREVSIAANLTNPHILPLHDSGQAGSFLYYVMPYIEGESLRDRLRRDGRQTPQDVCRILRQVADALAYAHAKGIVHRDIKPENIMMADRNAFVMDFGIAKAVSAAKHDDQTVQEGLTRVGAVIGTPAYMAPEQALGAPDIDHRVDIYALGVMAYEMLTGKQPFTGTTPQEILKAHIAETLDPAPIRNTTTPPAIVDLVSRSLEKSPADRWQTVSEMLPYLEAASVGSEHVPRISSRGRGVWIASGAFGIVFAVWLVLWLLAGNGGGSAVGTPKSIAVLPFSDLSPDGSQEFFSDGLADELITSLSRIERLRVAGRTSSFLFRDRREGLQAIGDQLNVQAILDGSVRRADNQIRVTAQLVGVDDGFEIWSDSYDREIQQIFDLQEELARSIVSALQVELSEDDGDLVRTGTNQVEAYNAYLLGRFHWNRRNADDLRIAARHFEDAIGLDSSFAAAWSGLADTYVLFPPYGVDDLSWRDAISRAVQAARRAVQLDDTSAEAYASLAIALDAQWDWSGAETAYKQAIERNPRYPTAHQWYAIYLLGVGRPSEALVEIRLAEDLDPLSAIIGSWVALMLDVAGRTREATAQFERVVTRHPDLGQIRRDAWLHYLRLGDYDNASVHLRRYLETTMPTLASRWADGVRDSATRESTLREIADSTAGDFKMSADLLAMLGRTDDALSILERRLESPDRLRDSAGAVRAYVLRDEIRNDPRFLTLLRNMQLP